MKIKLFLLAVCLSAFGSISFAQTKKTAAIAPDQVVRNLYAVQKAGSGPFFQYKNRSSVDKYFAREFADLIWKDAVDAKAGGGIGTIDFDPLYDAQDTRITGFKIGKPEYGEGNLQVADVPVNFKNMKKAVTILFRLEQDSRKVWKISDIYYPNSESEETKSLKTILTGAANTSN